MFCSGMFVYNALINMRPRIGHRYTVVDLREQEQYDSNHILCALSLPIHDLLEQHEQLFHTSVESLPLCVTIFLNQVKAWPKQTLIFCHDNEMIEDVQQYVLKIYSLITNQLVNFDKSELKISILRDTMDAFSVKYGTLLCTSILKPNRNSISLDRNTKYPNEIVEDFIFLGGILHAHDTAVLNALNIRHILNLTTFSESFFQSKRDPVKPSPSDQMKLQISITDMQKSDIKSKFVEAIQFIEEVKQNRKPGERLLIHCAQGVSRSSTIVIAYLMKSQNMKLQEALSHVRQNRRIINPNPGFMKQLSQFESEIHGLQ
jgi:predicted protein tyrosine phosphatase